MLTKYQQFFTGRPTVEIAKDLLGKLVKYQTKNGIIGGYIVETEAYLGEKDSASHAFNGRRTGYSESLYGMPGNIYLNIDKMIENRQMAGVNITNGPGKLVQALGIHSRDLDGQPMETSPLTVDLHNYKIPGEIAISARIGVNLKGKDGLSPRRFYVKGNPYVSNVKKQDMDLECHGWKG